MYTETITEIIRLIKPFIIAIEVFTTYGRILVSISVRYDNILGYKDVRCSLIIL